MSSTAYLESRILSADPIELIQILYEHAILAVVDARRQLAAGDIAARSKAVSQCIAILGELDASLNHQAGGPLSQELARLYEYMQVQLTLGNFEQKDEPFASVETVLRTLADGWKSVRPADARVSELVPAEVPSDPWDMYQVAEPEVGQVAHAWCA